MMAVTRNTPFKDRLIKDLNFSEFKVAVSGTVMGKTDTNFLLSDGTGEVSVNIASLANDTESIAPRIVDQDFVRVMGRVMPYDGSFELQAEIIQSLSGLEKETFFKLHEQLFKKT